MVLQTDKDHVTPGSFHVLQPKNPSRIFLDLRTRSQLCPRRHCQPTPATFSSLHRLPCLAFNSAFINQLLSQPPAPRSPAEAGPWHPATGREAGRGLGVPSPLWSAAPRPPARGGELPMPNRSRAPSTRAPHPSGLAANHPQDGALGTRLFPGKAAVCGDLWDARYLRV